ncbi:hypothetical protein D3C72_1349280 [compost metagenome]
MPLTLSSSSSSWAPAVLAWASPMEPTSTPISLSLVDMSAPTKRVSPPHRLATAARAIW